MWGPANNTRKSVRQEEHARRCHTQGEWGTKEGSRGHGLGPPWPVPLRDALEIHTVEYFQPALRSWIVRPDSLPGWRLLSSLNISRFRAPPAHRSCPSCFQVGATRCWYWLPPLPLPGESESVIWVLPAALPALPTHCHCCGIAAPSTDQGFPTEEGGHSAGWLPLWTSSNPAKVPQAGCGGRGHWWEESDLKEKGVFEGIQLLVGPRHSTPKRTKAESRSGEGWRERGLREQGCGWLCLRTRLCTWFTHISSG